MMGRNRDSVDGMDWNKASGLSGIGNFVLTFLILAIMLWQIRGLPMETIRMNPVIWLLFIVAAAMVVAALLHWKAAKVGRETAKIKSQPQSVASTPAVFRIVAHQEFRNQNVLLDGCDYVGCTFRNVTFVYNGTAPFAITLPFTTEGQITLTTERDSLVPLLRLLKYFESHIPPLAFLVPSGR